MVFLIITVILAFSFLPAGSYAKEAQRQGKSLEQIVSQSVDYKFHDTPILSPDNRWAVVTGKQEKRYSRLLLDVTSGRVKCILPRLLDIRAVIFSSKNRTFTAFGRTQFRTLSLDTCKDVKPAEKWDQGYGKVRLSPDKHIIATANIARPNVKIKNMLPKNSIIKLWSAKTGQALTTLVGHETGIRNFVFSVDGKTLISSSYDKTIRIWDVSTGQLRKTLKFKNDAPYNLVFSPDSAYVVAYASSLLLTNDRLAYLIDLENGKIKKKFDTDDKPNREERKYYNLTGPNAGGSFFGMRFSQDSRSLFGQKSGAMIVWDTKSGRKRQSMNGLLTNFVSPIDSDVFIGGGFSSLYIYDANNRNLLAKSSRDILPSTTKAVLSDDGTTILVLGDYEVQVWKVDNRVCASDCTVEPYKKLTQDEKVAQLVKALKRQDIDKADQYFDSVKSKISEEIFLDYVELNLLYEYNYHTWDALTAYRKTFKDKMTLLPRAKAIETRFLTMVETKIRKHQSARKHSEVSDRLDGLSQWNVFTKHDISILFYDMTLGALNAGHKDLAKKYAEMYTRQSQGSPEIMSRHAELKQLRLTLSDND